MLKPHWLFCVVGMLVGLGVVSCGTTEPTPVVVPVPRPIAIPSGVMSTPIPTPTTEPTFMDLNVTIPKPRPVRVPTPDPATTVTAEMTVWRCGLYESIVWYWIDMEMSPEDEFHHLTAEHVPVIMAVMAQESACLEDATDGLSIGLMQVIPRDWLPNSGTNRMNVYTGMYILDRSMDLAHGDLELALAYYNCGVPKVQADACGTYGGPAYAERVLYFWLPYFAQDKLSE